MSRLEWTLNTLASILVGIFLTLTYQRIQNWYRQRNGQGKLPPVSTQAYFGTGLMLLGIVTALYSYSGKLAAERRADCQVDINQLNVTASNEKNSRLTSWIKGQLKLDNKELTALLSQDPNGLQKITDALQIAVDTGHRVVDYTDSHPSIPVVVCDKTNNSPDVTPPPSNPTEVPTAGG